MNTREQNQAVLEWGNAMINEIQQVAESNIYDRPGLMMAVLILRASLLVVTVNDKLSIIKQQNKIMTEDIVKSAEKIIKEESK